MICVTGKGVKFAVANKNSWGKGDYEDCMSGVDAVLARGQADAERTGAWLTNIYSMYSQSDIQRYLRFFYNDQSPWDNQELYWDRSPMKYVKKVKAPTMIMHGRMDTRLPPAQAQEFYRAPLERNVPVEFVVYPREGHGFVEPRHLLDRQRRYQTFFGKYLDNPPVTEPAEEEKARPPKP